MNIRLQRAVYFASSSHCKRDPTNNQIVELILQFLSNWLYFRNSLVQSIFDTSGISRTFIYGIFQGLKNLNQKKQIEVRKMLQKQLDNRFLLTEVLIN